MSTTTVEITQADGKKQQWLVHDDDDVLVLVAGARALQLPYKVTTENPLDVTRKYENMLATETRG
ncbi:MAG TPA: hypothetical protein VD838_05895 [Anaeromyxobacteraceae bacterium]|nr:hypothetical protein [Anaeromyxobacteraceae bacterium]